MKRIRWILVGLAVGMLVGTPPAMAQTAVTSRAVLGGNDHVEWSFLGPAYHPDGSRNFLSPDFSVTSHQGLSIQASTATPSFLFDTSDGGFEAFGPGQILLYTNDPNTLTFTFSAPIRGLGTEMVPGSSGPTYSALLRLYGDGDVFLGEYSFSGSSAGPPTFMGVAGSAANIRKAVFELPANEARTERNPFAINRLDLLTDAGDVTAVPEPGSLVLFLPAFGVVAVLRRRKPGSMGH